MKRFQLSPPHQILAQGGIWVVVNNEAKDGGYFCPGTNQITHLGLWNNSWEGIYAKNAPSQTSDRKAKTNIVELEKREKTTRAFFMKLKPSMYNMLGREGEPEDRVDFGFITQDVEQAITETFGSHKFSLVEKHYKPSEEEIPQVMPEENGEVDERREISLKNFLTTENMTAEEEREFLDAQPDEKLSYHLKYTELIPINTLMIQENIEDIEILQKELLAKDKKIEELEDRLANIEKLLAKLS